jgi:hypothetical protein
VAGAWFGLSFAVLPWTVAWVGLALALAAVGYAVCIARRLPVEITEAELSLRGPLGVRHVAWADVDRFGLTYDSPGSVWLARRDGSKITAWKLGRLGRLHSGTTAASEVLVERLNGLVLAHAIDAPSFAL